MFHCKECYIQVTFYSLALREPRLTIVYSPDGRGQTSLILLVYRMTFHKHEDLPAIARYLDTQIPEDAGLVLLSMELWTAAKKALG